MKIYIVKDIDAFDESFVECCATFFPNWRKEDMLRYKYHKGKIKNALAYIILIHALREEGIFSEMPIFSYNEHGKPSLENYPGWFFNLSHSKTAVCCVLSRRDVGIDIEEVGEYKEDLAAYICNDDELDKLRGSIDKADEFYRLWTRKEAVFKMLGSGITKEIKNILNVQYINVESLRIGDIWLSLSYRNEL